MIQWGQTVIERYLHSRTANREYYRWAVVVRGKWVSTHPTRSLAETARAHLVLEGTP